MFELNDSACPQVTHLTDNGQQIKIRIGMDFKTQLRGISNLDWKLRKQIDL